MLPTIKLAGVALVACALCAGGGAAVGYSRGKAAAEARHSADVMRAYVAAVDRAAAVLADVLVIGQQLADSLAASHARERGITQRVREAIDEDPDFGAVRRPADLQRLRREQLERINATTAAD
jgi:hypothetical protein